MKALKIGYHESRTVVPTGVSKEAFLGRSDENTHFGLCSPKQFG